MSTSPVTPPKISMRFCPRCGYLVRTQNGVLDIHFDIRAQDARRTDADWNWCPLGVGLRTMTLMETFSSRIFLWKQKKALSKAP